MNEKLPQENNGFFNLYKPTGYTSHDVVAVLRRHLPRKTKVGHTGTLDPQATGVLPICIGKATRLAEYFTAMPKTYLGELTLGSSTTTYDKWGEITQQATPEQLAAVNDEAVSAILPEFTGYIQQVPPMMSAVKINGQKLYKLARAGVEVERPAREVRIFSLKIKELALPKVQLEVVCSSGTYIRSLFHDIGTKLGVEHLPLIELQTENDFQHALHGREIMLGLSEAEAPACRVVYQGRLVGIGETCYEAQGCACNEMLLLHMDKVLL